MATKFAIAVRHRTLLLPWDFHWRFDGISKPYSSSPASGVAFQILGPVGQWPDEASYLNDTFLAYTTPAGNGLCYCCKNLTEYKGLHFTCDKCMPVDSYSYFTTYSNALHFASQSWELPTRIEAENRLIQKLQSSTNLKISNSDQWDQTELESWENSEETTVQRLKRLLAIRPTRLTGN